MKGEPRVAEVLDAQSAYQVERPVLRVERRTCRAELAGRDDFAFNETALFIESDGQDRRHALDSGNADSVVRCKVAEAVGDQAVVIALHGANDVRAVTNDEVGAGVDDHARETHDIAAGFIVILFFREGQARDVTPFGAAMKRHDHDVMRRGELTHGLLRARVVEQHVRILGHGIGEHGNAQTLCFEACEVTFPAGVKYARSG